MHLTPREQERLLVSSAADLARRRLGRGARLGAPDAIALVCDEICEMAWDDVPLDDVVDRARHVVPSDALLDGVAALVPSVEVEALFPHGTVLVHVDQPFGQPGEDPPGGIRVVDAPRELAPDRARIRATLDNTGTLTVWVSSHLPLGSLNPAVVVTLAGPAGLRPADVRLDLPAGAALKVPAGERVDADAVTIARSGR